jgi:hypothetical protein
MREGERERKKEGGMEKEKNQRKWAEKGDVCVCKRDCASLPCVYLFSYVWVTYLRGFTVESRVSGCLVLPLRAIYLHEDGANAC